MSGERGERGPTGRRGQTGETGETGRRGKSFIDDGWQLTAYLLVVLCAILAGAGAQHLWSVELNQAELTAEDAAKANRRSIIRVCDVINVILTQTDPGTLPVNCRRVADDPRYRPDLNVPAPRPGHGDP